MIGFTAMASTPLMEEKQKTTIEAITELFQVEKVVITLEATAPEVREIKSENETKSSLKIKDDVGWQIQNYNILNKENVASQDYDIHRIREDTSK